MKALVWRGGRTFRVEDVPEPRPEGGEIVVKVEAAAVCGSDFHMDDFGSAPPLVLGHEVAGTVAEVGPGVDGPRVGDRVALGPVVRCGNCWCCTHGVDHLCTNFRHLGWGDMPGGWAEFVAIDAANAHSIAEGVSFVAASLAEPMAVCYESFQRAGLKCRDQVLIIGDGPFGFLHAQVAKALGAGTMIVAGHHDHRLARIAEHTQAITCNTHNCALEEVLAAHVPVPGVDIVIEASGSGSAPRTGIDVLRPRGTLVIFSYIWQPEALDLGAIHMRELNVLGSCRSLKAFEPCLDLLSRGLLDTAALVDLELPLVDHEQAARALEERKADVFKVVFLPQA